MHAEQRVSRAKLAVAARRAKKSNDPVDLARVDQLRAEYRTEALAAYISRVVDSAPPLTVEQRDRLAGLLQGGGPC